MNLVFSNGETWRKQSRAINAVFQGPPPVKTFVYNTNRLLEILGSGGLFRWDDLSQRITLDILGEALLDHKFDALNEPNSPLLENYRSINQAITAPPYVFLPFLDKYFPRKRIIERVENLRSMFANIIRKKLENRGQDLISRMLENSELNFVEVLDNLSVLFVAGHVSRVHQWH